jgi:hypothetical protein
MGNYLPTGEWSAICKNCKRVFDLGTSYSVRSGSFGFDYFMPLSTMKFPNSDTSEVELECPHCRTEQKYANAELMRPSHIAEAEQKNVVAKFRQEIKALESEKDYLAKKVSELDVEMKRLKTNNDKLTEDNNILSHALQDYLTQKEKPV